MPLPDAETLLSELSQQIAPHLTPRTVMVGIHTGGAWLAQRLHEALRVQTPLGTLDVSFHRDDFNRIGLHPEVKPSAIPFEVEGCDILLVDDVLNSGRTVRAAMNELFDYGRPASIRLAVLVDRGGRELPIAAQFIGTTLELSPDQNLWLERDAAGKLVFSLHRDDENSRT